MVVMVGRIIKEVRNMICNVKQEKGEYLYFKYLGEKGQNVGIWQLVDMPNYITKKVPRGGVRPLFLTSPLFLGLVSTV